MKRIAIALILAAAFIFAVQANEPIRVYHDSINQLTDETLVIGFPDCRINSQAIEVRAALPDADVGSPLVGFGILWNMSPDVKEYYSATLRPVTRDRDEVIDNRYVVFTVAHHNEGVKDSIIIEKRMRNGFGLEYHENTLGVEIDRESNKVTIYGGNSQPEVITELVMDSLPYQTMGITAMGKALISMAVSEYTLDPATALKTGWTEKNLAEYCNSASAPEGIYRYLDRDNNPKYCRLGGDYTIALVTSPRGGFDIIYIDGAKINPKLWHRGMLKGHLSPTVFQNHYDLEWYDSSFTALSDECSADIEQNAILRLNFPMLKSSVRFSLIPRDK